MPFLEVVRDTLQCLNPQAVVAAIAAGDRWNHRRDVPDIAGFRDFAHAPDRAVALLEHRLADGRLTGQTHKMPVAKPDPTKSDQPLRWACVLDPLTELGIRLHMSPIVDAVEARARRIGDDVVCAGRARTGDTPAGWSQLDPGYLLDRRAETVLDELDADTWRALGQADVKNCYPTLTATTVCAGLSDSGVADLLIAPVQQVLLDLAQVWQYKGLPVGPEWAPVLANAALFALDDDLQAAGVRHLRWIDDVAFVFHGLGWTEAREAFEASLHRLGLEPNPRKYKYIKDRERAIAAYADPEITTMLLAASMDERVEHARRIHAETVASDTPHAGRLRFTLGVLSGQGITDALGPLTATPDLLAVAPSHYGRYLRRMITDGAADLDWIVDRATTRRSQRDAIGQLHLLAACASTSTSWTTEHAAAFLACADDRDTWSPLRSWAAAAYASTSKFKPTHAVERAESTGDTHLQRAWTLTLASRAPGRKAGKAARRLRAFPDCGPAAQLVIDGG